MSDIKKIYRRRRLGVLCLVALIVGAVLIVIGAINSSKNKAEKDDTEPDLSAVMIEPIGKMAETFDYPDMSETCVKIPDGKIDAKNAVLLDISTNKIIAEKGGNERIYPASMTKIMTILVAAENIPDVNKTFTITNEILTPLIEEDATRAGFVEGETVKLIDLFYGAALPSGADCTVGLAIVVSGSEENFVKLMNEKCEKLGLKNTHFVNTSGLYGADHYSTPTDMAVIMREVLGNELCRKVLSTYKYTTSPTTQHPKGIELESTMFSRMYGNEVEGVTIEGGKTGYTNEAKHCLVSYCVKDEKEFIALTSGGSGKYKPIYDAFTLYKEYLPKNVFQAPIVTTAAK
ncbi:MAG: D-alanyl-D-alanine carboxypeptidase [Oscillospiraceae bacterium]